MGRVEGKSGITRMCILLLFKIQNTYENFIKINKVLFLLIKNIHIKLLVYTVSFKSLKKKKNISHISFFYTHSYNSFMVSNIEKIHVVLQVPNLLPVPGTLTLSRSAVENKTKLLPVSHLTTRFSVTRRIPKTFPVYGYTPPPRLRVSLSMLTRQITQISDEGVPEDTISLANFS